MGDSELRAKIERFIDDFECVFDTDWEFSRLCLAEDSHDIFIATPTGTFLRPNVPDESNNWGNRGALLASYRELVAAVRYPNESGVTEFRPGETVQVIGINHVGRVEYVKRMAHRNHPIYGVSYWWNGTTNNVELDYDEIRAHERKDSDGK